MKPRYREHLVFAVMLLAVLAAGSPVFAGEMAVWSEVAPNRDCGVNCLVIACKLLGKATDKQEISTLAKLGVNGTNFKNLADAARQKGLYCRGVKWSLAQLRAWNRPAIAHWREHFVLVRGFEGPKGINIIDPPKMPFVMDTAEFQKKWDGKLLLLSDEPISPFVGLGRTYACTLAGILCLALIALLLRRCLHRRRPSAVVEDSTSASPPSALVIVLFACALSFSPAHAKPNTKSQDPPAPKSILEIADAAPAYHKIDFGRARQNDKLTHVLVLTNKSPNVVKIKGVATSCSCTAAILSKNEIPPAQSGEVRITLDTTGLFGKVYKPCLVQFENPALRPVKLDLLAFVYSPSARFTVSGLYFDKVPAGAAAVRAFTIVNKDDPAADWRIVKVATSSPNLTAEYLPNRAEVRCALSPDAPFGPINESLLITINSQDGSSTIQMPLRGDVMPPLKTIPARLYLGAVRADRPVSVAFKVTASLSSNPSPLELAPPRNTSLRVKVTRRNNEEAVCLAEIPAPHKKGFFRGEILLKTGRDTQPELRIPFAGFSF